MSTIIRIANIAKIRKELNDFRKSVGDACKEEVDELANMVENDSKLIAPYKSGRLSASITVDRGIRQTVLIKANARGRNGYNYSVIQHERLDFHHEYGEAKYIEKPLKRYSKEFFDNVLRRLRK